MPDETQDVGDVSPESYDDVFADDAESLPSDTQPSSDAVAAGTGEAAAPVTPDATAEPAPTDPTAAPSTEPPAIDGAAGIAAAPALDPFARPPDAAPFNFRVDGANVAIDGAWVNPNGDIVIPRRTWETDIRPRWIANRGGWEQRERGYTEKIRTLESSQSAKEQQAEAVLQQLDSLMQKGPDAMAQWLDNYERNFPLLKAEAEKAALQRQLDSKAELESRRSEEDRRQQEIPRMQNDLAGSLEGLLKDPRFAVLSGTNDENVALLRDLWQNHADAFFWRADRDYPEYGVPRGTMVFQPDRLEQWVSREADRTTRLLARSQKAAAADVRNKAATAPSKPFTPHALKPAAPRAPSSPTPAPAPAVNDYEDWKEKMLRDENWTVDE